MQIKKALNNFWTYFSCTILGLVVLLIILIAVNGLRAHKKAQNLEAKLAQHQNAPHMSWETLEAAFRTLNPSQRDELLTQMQLVWGFENETKDERIDQTLRKKMRDNAREELVDLIRIHLGLNMFPNADDAADKMLDVLEETNVQESESDE